MNVFIVIALAVVSMTYADELPAGCETDGDKIECKSDDSWACQVTTSGSCECTIKLYACPDDMTCPDKKCVKTNDGSLKCMPVSYTPCTDDEKTECTRKGQLCFMDPDGHYECVQSSDGDKIGCKSDDSWECQVTTSGSCECKIKEHACHDEMTCQSKKCFKTKDGSLKCMPLSYMPCKPGEKAECAKKRLTCFMDLNGDNVCLQPSSDCSNNKQTKCINDGKVCKVVNRRNICVDP